MQEIKYILQGETNFWKYFIRQRGRVYIFLAIYFISLLLSKLPYFNIIFAESLVSLLVIGSFVFLFNIKGKIALLFFLILYLVIAIFVVLEGMNSLEKFSEMVYMLFIVAIAKLIMEYIKDTNEKHY